LLFQPFKFPSSTDFLLAVGPKHTGIPVPYVACKTETLPDFVWLHSWPDKIYSLVFKLPPQPIH